MNIFKIKKGDIILYRFGGKMQEAKVLKIYSNDYVKVRHKGEFLD
jgi:hypothetical protein